MRIVHSIAGAALTIAAFGAAADAHHAQAGFDGEKKLTLVGTIKEWQWTSPHSWIQIVAPDESGADREWGIELGNPAGMARRGWTRNTLKPGQLVIMTINPAKDGSNLGRMLTLTDRDGKSIIPQAGDGGAGAPPT